MQPWLAVIVILAIGFVVGFILDYVFFSRLRDWHPQRWEALGRPTVFLNNCVANGAVVQRFLWERQYRELGDERFIRFADFLRMYWSGYAIFFVVVLAVLLVNSMNGRWVGTAK